MQKESLKRELSLTQAVALNMIDMVGIGPFVVLPIVIGIMGGPQHISAWIAGAALALIDGFIWAEYGAALPRAGGSYVFLREAYGQKWGRLMSFLFIWQTMIQAPLVIASGSIGFAQYLSYIVPLDDATRRIASGTLVIALTILLYRKISTVGKISVALWIGVLGTMAWFIVGGLSHFDAKLAFDYPEGAWDFKWAFWVALGQASVQTMYSYLGYYNVNHLGGEIKQPEKNIPRAIFISIIGIAVLYLAMQFAVIGVIPWQEAKDSQFIVSTLIERLYGTTAATIATVLVLWIAFASLFAVMLGYSRIPYAAALDGNFFSIMAKVHPTKNFPHVSLLWLGAAAFVFSLLFRMADVIKAILAMRILVQFIGGAVGIMLLRKALGSGTIPFKMWLYPLPAIAAIVLWASIMVSTGFGFALSGLGMTLLGIIVYFVREKVQDK
ncbi:MAG: amino acid permease [Ignavibacteriales bacterium]|nr:amino acid permease [Ignavibacteriales bacterium]